MIKILLTGTTTSGKTTLINEVKALALPGIVYVEEEARQYLEAHPEHERDPQLQDYLYQRQVGAEIAAEYSEAELLICDRGIPDNIAHALLFGVPVKNLWREWSRSYDGVYFFNAADINYTHPTPLQLRIDPKRNWVQFRRDLDTHLLLALSECGLPFQVLTGSIEQRLHVIESYLRSHLEKR